MGCTLVDKDQPMRVHAGQFLAELPPLLLDLRAVLLVGVENLLLAREPELLQGAPDGRKAARDIEPLAQVLEGGIGLLANQLLESLQVVLPKRGGASAGRRFGIPRAGATMELQQVDDEREAHEEALSDLAQQALLRVDAIDDAWSEILGIGGHGSPPDRRQNLPTNRMPTKRKAL
jgi:hypothetical protein